MNIVRMKVCDIDANYTLAYDAIISRKKIATAGTELNERILQLLERHGIHYVYVYQEEQRMLHTFMPTMQDEPAYLNIFATWRELNIEGRYGHLLLQREGLLQVKDLFEQYLQQPSYASSLAQLYAHDIDTYMHSIDTFTLTMLLLRKLEIPYQQSICSGILFYMLGKMHVPRALLTKKQQLSDLEQMTVHRQLLQGERMLAHMGATDAASFVKSYHEHHTLQQQAATLMRADMQLIIDLLHIVHHYTALTAKKGVYGKSASEAVAYMYEHSHRFEPLLLQQFVQALHIYPQQAVVLLSTGVTAVVEQVPAAQPNYPIVRIITTNAVVRLAMEQSLSIVRLIAYEVTSFEQLFAKFSEHFLKGNMPMMEQYYQKLAERLKPHEFFTKIYIPIYEICAILHVGNQIAERQIAQSRHFLIHLMEQSLHDARLYNSGYENVLMLVNFAHVDRVLVQLLEGILHSVKLYPIIVDQQYSNESLIRQIEAANTKYIVLLGVEQLPILGPKDVTPIFQLNEHQLTFQIKSMSAKDITKSYIIEQLAMYNYNNKPLLKGLIER